MAWLTWGTSLGAGLSGARLLADDTVASHWEHPDRRSLISNAGWANERCQANPAALVFSPMV
jgi:hypothetical protein